MAVFATRLRTASTALLLMVFLGPWTRLAADPTCDAAETGHQPRLIQAQIGSLESKTEDKQAQPLRLRVHSIARADPTLVLRVMQLMCAGEQGVRLAIDSKADNLIVLATDAQHSRIQETLQALQRRGAPHPIREVTPSRFHLLQDEYVRSNSEHENLPREQRTSEPADDMRGDDKDSAGPNSKRTVLPAPAGFVRIVHLEGTDLLLIRAGHSAHK